MPIKTNTWYSGAVEGTRRSSIFASWTPYKDGGYASQETCVTISHERVHGGRSWSGGGPFVMNRDASWFYPPTKMVSDNLFVGTVRMGPITTAWTDTSGFAELTDTQADAVGTSCIAATEPTRPVADFSVFAGETLHDGFPKIPGLEMKEKVARAKAAGGEYLNYQFGWIPLVADVHDFAHAVKNSDEILRKYQEDSNHFIHRQLHFPLQLTQKVADDVTFATIPAKLTLRGSRIQTCTERRWFEADYMFYLPTGTDANSRMRLHGAYARKLLGTRLTPEVLWNLAPWSWAADWFGNFGDIVHNASAMLSDSLVIRHAYVMQHNKRVTFDYATHSTYGDFARETIVERKYRRPANPFGFGTSGLATTARQKAIIAALGLTHAGRVAG